MMKRRWSNNGGFAALRMLDESSSEVTSSSAGLVAMATAGGITMSPGSLGSPEYSDGLELWYDDTAYQHHSVITAAVNGVPNNQHHAVITASEPKGNTQINVYKYR